MAGTFICSRTQCSSVVATTEAVVSANAALLAAMPSSCNMLTAELLEALEVVEQSCLEVLQRIQARKYNGVENICIFKRLLHLPHGVQAALYSWLDIRHVARLQTCSSAFHKSDAIKSYSASLPATIVPGSRFRCPSPLAWAAVMEAGVSLAESWENAKDVTNAIQSCPLHIFDLTWKVSGPPGYSLVVALLIATTKFRHCQPKVLEELAQLSEQFDDIGHFIYALGRIDQIYEWFCNSPQLRVNCAKILQSAVSFNPSLVIALERIGIFQQIAQLLERAKTPLANELMCIVWKSCHACHHDLSIPKTCAAAGLVPLLVQRLHKDDTKIDALNCLDCIMQLQEKASCDAFRDLGGVQILVRLLKRGEHDDFELDILTHVLCADQESSRIASEAGCIPVLMRMLTTACKSSKSTSKQQKGSTSKSDLDSKHDLSGMIADSLSCMLLVPETAKQVAKGLQRLVSLLECPHAYAADAAAASLAVLFKVDKESRSPALRLGARELLMKLCDRGESDDKFQLGSSVASFLGLPADSWQRSQLAAIALAALGGEMPAAVGAPKRSAETFPLTVAKALKTK